jgi:hypothetical protein
MSETVVRSKAKWWDADVVDWRTLIIVATTKRPVPVQAQTFFRRYNTASQAVELGCADGNRYVVKGLRRNDAQQGRMMFNDQVAARVGVLLSAPVPEVALVEVTAELIAANPDKKDQMGHMLPAQLTAPYVSRVSRSGSTASSIRITRTTGCDMQHLQYSSAG